MPVPVHLSFIPPNAPDLAELHIYEAAAQDGPYDEIEVVTPPAIGVEGNYLTEYTTIRANSATDWFAIEWIDAKGASFGMSQGVQGGVESLVGEIVERVELRDPTIKKEIAEQEAEAAVETYFSTDDALSVLESQATAREISGLTLLTIVRSRLALITLGASQSYTAGLVSEKGATATSLSDFKSLLNQANELLGTSFSVILQMADNEIAGGSVVAAIPDQSRLLMDIL